MLQSDTKPSARETILSYSSGILFAIGWWIWIDGVAYAFHLPEETNRPVFGHWVPGIVSSIGLLMINAVNWTDLDGFGFGGLDDEVQKRARIWLLFSFTMAFGGIIASIWISSVNWFSRPATEKQTDWPGVALILQNCLIFISGLCFRFAKPMQSESAF